MNAAKSQPLVSFGVPIYNGEATVCRCLDSILQQDYQDLEVIVCDNASTDGTRDILRAYRDRDARIKLYLNDINIGQIENCNRVFKLSSGKYFRWLGVSDWIEPTYLSKCVNALEGDPGAIAVTTLFKLHIDGKRPICVDYRGERVESNVPEDRFARMLWFFHAGHELYDPLYSLIRSDAFARTGLIRMMTKGDWMMAAELSLLGRFQHVPECLAHRQKPPSNSADSLEVRRRYHPEKYDQLYSSPYKLFRVLLSIIRRARLDHKQKLKCFTAALGFLRKEALVVYGRRLSKFRRNRLGLTRERLFGFRIKS